MPAALVKTLNKAVDGLAISRGTFDAERVRDGGIC
jgi:hypothetical protein